MNSKINWKKEIGSSIIFLVIGIILWLILISLYAFTSKDSFGLGGYMITMFFAIFWISLGILLLGLKKFKIAFAKYSAIILGAIGVAYSLWWLIGLTLSWLNLI